MPKEVCTIGCITYHGAKPVGKVIESSDDTFYNGKGVARVGDKGTCREHGTKKIVEANQEKVYVNGKLVAVEGAKLQCGAIIRPSGDKSWFID